MWLPASLVLASAALHAGWNLIVKSEDDKLAGAWITLLFAPIVLSPLLLWTGLPPPDAWPILAVSAIAHAAYMIGLARAYELGHLSVVYPVARGVAPLLVALGAVLFLGERLPTLAVAAIVLTTAGILWIGLSARAVSGPASGLGWAMGTAGLIALYTLIDKVGVSRAHPVSYAIVLFSLDAAFATPYVLLRRDLGYLVDTWWRRKGILSASGLFSVGSYLLVLVAMRMMQVSYVAPLRETAVIFGAFLGWRVLGEALGQQRVVASVLVASGLSLLALAASR